MYRYVKRDEFVIGLPARDIPDTGLTPDQAKIMRREGLVSGVYAYEPDEKPVETEPTAEVEQFQEPAPEREPAPRKGKKNGA